MKGEKRLLGNYFENLFAIAHDIRVTDRKGTKLNFGRGIAQVKELVESLPRAGKKIIFIGNGGSAAISSHMAIDFWKNGGIKAISFNDASQLTCLGNDYGYGHVFERPVEMFAEDGDMLVAISSSGKSENILRAVQCAHGKGCKVVTLSGFGSDNPLSGMGDVNFYVPCSAYGPVEVLHHSIYHCIIDTVMKKNG